MLYSSFIPLYIGDKPPSILIPTETVDTRQRLYRLNVPCKYLGVEVFDILKFCRFGKFFIHFFLTEHPESEILKCFENPDSKYRDE